MIGVTLSNWVGIKCRQSFPPGPTNSDNCMFVVPFSHEGSRWTTFMSFRFSTTAVDGILCGLRGEFCQKQCWLRAEVNLPGSTVKSGISRKEGLMASWRRFINVILHYIGRVLYQLHPFSIKLPGTIVNPNYRGLKIVLRSLQSCIMSDARRIVGIIWNCFKR